MNWMTVNRLFLCKEQARVQGSQLVYQKATIHPAHALSIPSSMSFGVSYSRWHDQSLVLTCGGISLTETTSPVTAISGQSSEERGIPPIQSQVITREVGSSLIGQILALTHCFGVLAPSLFGHIWHDQFFTANHWRKFIRGKNSPSLA